MTTHETSQSMTAPSPPKHVAIIMDGNGRWAQKRGLSRREGHKKGVEAVRNLVDYLKSTELKTLTLYAFSTENWRRPQSEVNFLMGLLKRYIAQDFEKLHQANVKIKVIGKHQGLQPSIIKLLDKAQMTTKNNDALTLQLAFNYGSWDEVINMVQSLIMKAQDKQLTAGDVDADLIRSHLMTANVSDPDLIIRTSGEYRLSNFMLLQSAYSELVFQSVLWPDYTPKDYDSAIEVYMNRERRYGTSAQNQEALENILSAVEVAQ